MKITRQLRFAFALITSVSIPLIAFADDEPTFEGFPKIGEYRQAERSLEVITSDGVKGVLRPKWTRAMTDLGGWPSMFRFKGDIYFVFYHGDAHRYKRFEATDKLKTYRSSDEGITWTEVASCPPNDPAKFQGTPEFLPVGETLYCYDFNGERQIQVRTTDDGVTWSEPQNCYKPPFYFWGAMYDPATKMFWCPPHAIPHVGKSSERQIHLINSENGIDWKFVSLVAPYDNASESTLKFDADGTLTVLIRRKYGTTSNVAVAKPPYQEWSISERPVIAEGEHFFEIAGQTFVGSRALYRGDDKRVLANPKIFDGRKAYSTIYRWTKDRELKEWAVMESMGDCSYPHLVETPTEILCAYYSQHENKVSKAFLCAFDKKEFLAEPKE
ncbi:MAG: sialidase family protein [Planctomycetaceae bacterium]